MIPSTVQGETSPDVGGVKSTATAAAPPTAKRESAASFSDVSKMTDPKLVIRRVRMRRIFMGVMAGAVGLLALAGLCSLVRRSDPPPPVQTKVAEPSPPPVQPPAAPVAADPAPAEPSPAAQAPEPQVPLASAVTSKTPAPRTTHRPKPAPNKARGTH